MNIIMKHIWRNIRSNGFRSLLIIISLALSAAVFYLCLNIRDDVSSSTEAMIQGIFKGYDILISGDWETEPPELPACSSQLGLRAELSLDETPAVVLYSADIDRLLADGMITLDSQMEGFRGWDASCAAMTRTKALYYGFALGEPFTVTTEAGEREFILAAYLESAGVFTALNTELTEVFTGQNGERPNLLYLSLEDDASMEEECSRLQQTYPDFLVTCLYDRSVSNGRLKSIGQLMSMILLLVMAITFYVISSTNSLILQYRIPVLGTFRSVGAAAGRTNGILIAENALYGLLAGIPGILCGELFRGIFRTRFLEVGRGNARLHYMLLVPVFAMLMNGIISLAAVLRVGRIPIKDLIFRRQSAASKPSRLWSSIGALLLLVSFLLAALNRHYVFLLLIAELLCGVIGMGLLVGALCPPFSRLLQKGARRLPGGSVWLGVRNLENHRINRSDALLVSVVISLVMVIYISASSVSAFFDSYRNNYPYDVMIKSVQGEERDFRYLKRLEGVENIVYEYWDYERILVNGERIKVCTVANDGFSNGIEAEEGLLKNLHDGETVVDRLFAERHDIAVGDVLKLQRGTGDEYELRVEGLCDSGVFNSTRITIVTTRRDFYRYVKMTPAVIGITASGDLYDLIHRINDEIARKTGNTYIVMAKQDYVNEALSEAMNLIKSVSLVPLLTILLALCGLVNNQLISFHQKRREYAVLYSVSMNRKQLAYMMLSELSSSFLVGCFSGLLMTLWLSKIVRDIVFVNLSYLPVVITGRQILLSLLLLFLLLCATALFPLRQLKRMNVVQEIKYE